MEQSRNFLWTSIFTIHAVQIKLVYVNCFEWPVNWHIRWFHPPLHLRCIPALEKAIVDVDAAYDSCNEAWARGEADKFRSDGFLDSETDLDLRKIEPMFWHIFLPECCSQ